MNCRLAVGSLLLGGLFGPLTFAAAVIISGSFRTNYSHVHQFISELGETGSNFAWVMNYFGFMLSASLILIFVVALPTHFPKTAVNRLGTVLLGMFAISVFLAGIYSCDVGCSPAEPSLEQNLHDIVSVIAFPAFTLGVFTWGMSFYRMPGWRGFGVYSLATAALSVLLLVTMVQSEATREGTGLYQRLFLGVLFFWQIVLSMRLWHGYKLGST